MKEGQKTVTVVCVEDDLLRIYEVPGYVLSKWISQMIADRKELGTGVGAILHTIVVILVPLLVLPWACLQGIHKLIRGEVAYFGETEEEVWLEEGWFDRAEWDGVILPLVGQGALKERPDLVKGNFLMFNQIFKGALEDPEGNCFLCTGWAPPQGNSYVIVERLGV